MKNFLGLIPALIFLGACSSTPNSKRTPSSTPQTVLTIPVSDVKAIVLADTAASTNCIKVTSVQPTSDPFTSIYSTHDQFNCSTIVPMAVSIDNKALNVDKTFESFHSHTLQAIPSEKDLTSGEALEKLHKENVALITDHYKDLKAGCMGANVVVTIKGNEVNLESANHLGKARCAAVKAFNAARNAKNKAWESTVQTYTTTVNRASTIASDVRETVTGTATQIGRDLDNMQRRAREMAADSIRPAPAQQ